MATRTGAFVVAAALTCCTPGSNVQAPENGNHSPAPAMVTSSADPAFQQPYIDIDEWRDTPVRHRYIHGGFRENATRFSFYFPPPEQYQGRFYQHITPVPDSENLAQHDRDGAESKIGFAIASGAYFVETNGGGKVDLSVPREKTDPTIGAYRANAAAARYSRIVAARVYERRHRPWGYAYGGSGGAYRTVGAMENTEGVWDGAVPYVLGSSMALPNVFTGRMHAMRVLRDRFPAIVDALEPGGSGDPYATLNAEERAALLEVTRMGFPPASWFDWKTMGVQGFTAIYEGVVQADPTYFTDFWTVPGYLGADPPASLLAARMQHRTSIAGPITPAEAARLGIAADTAAGGVDDAFRSGGPPRAFRLAKRPPAIDFQGGDLVIESGRAKGSHVTLSKIVEDVVVVNVAAPETLAALAAGDEVIVDNSNYLALQTYHRHQVPDPDFHVWDQFRGPHGKPIYPQRPRLLGPIFAKDAAGSLQTGRFEGKMILVESLWDREAYPWQADWYRTKVEDHRGRAIDDHFRLYFTEHALHGDEAGTNDASRTVDYLGELGHALRDIAAWAEHGTAPPPSTSYRITDGQVLVPPTATERRGIQPTVTLHANDAALATVPAGATVTFLAEIDVPPGTGRLVSAGWDFVGNGKFAEAPLTGSGTGAIRMTTTHVFPKPGTYFVGIHVATQRESDEQTPYARPSNLARARVVVR